MQNVKLRYDAGEFDHDELLKGFVAEELWCWENNDC